MKWIQLFLAVLMVDTITSQDNQITIGAIVPQNTFLRRGYSGALRRAVSVSGWRNHDILQHYEVQSVLIEIDTWSPTEILTVLSDTIIAQNINTLIYIGDVSYVEENVPSEQYLMKTADFLGIPVIAWLATNAFQIQSIPGSLALQLTPTITHQCKSMLALLSRYHWHEFSILTGSAAGHDLFINNMRDLTEIGEYDEFKILTVLKINDVFNPTILYSSLDKLRNTETRVVLMYASKREAEEIMPLATKMGLTSKEYIWVASKSAVGELDGAMTTSDEFPLGMFGISFKTSVESRKKALADGVGLWTQGMMKLLEANESDPTQREFKDLTLMPSAQDYEDGKKWKSGRLLYEYIRNQSLPHVHFEEDGGMIDAELNIVNMQQGKGGKGWKEIGRWNSRNGILLEDITWPGEAPIPPAGRPEKYQLKVVTLQERPYVVYTNPDPETGSCVPQAHLCRVASLNETRGVENATRDPSLYQCCSGLCIDLLRMLGRDIGFEFELFEVEDKKWGAFDRYKGEWNGLVRAVMDQKADMVVTSLKITPERNRMIDFSVPFMETGITIVVAVRSGIVSATAFLEPYDYLSWCIILAICVHATGAAILIFEWLSQESVFVRGNKPVKEHRFSLFDSYWLMWAMLFGAAVNVDNPRGVSSRFLANIWALFAVVFTASYTANLAAFMIIKEDYDQLTGIEDWRLMNPFEHEPPFKFATVPHGSTETNLKHNYPHMYLYMKPYNRSTVIEGVRAVKDGEINAFIYDATVLEYLASHDDGCMLRTVGNWYAMTGYGVGFPKGSKWSALVNKYMLKYQYDGELEQLQKFWLAGACSEEDDGESSAPLGILNFTSAFFLLAGGMFLGGLILLLEHAYFKFFRGKLRKLDKCGCCGLISLSMGQSLTFEQTIREVIELKQHHKCKNPACETHVWKLKHELDLALLTVDRMQKQIGNVEGTSTSKPRKEQTDDTQDPAQPSHL